ncbi:ThuA domain-containing protein [Rhodopirellula sallentina]|uniref:Glycosyl hydrolase (Putative secreted protein) n=1 Tax=Rhodopirellula sallentina SM41 TaxID=1263870 RepID=M5TYS9_9BACT|nr:ThuA domain-containing protein [Rhodopirellula sallentina]EMI54372.1 glycosyl hydrolase (putative secreted protein) [Rhodopirellula sallentina SM41]
MTRRRLWTRGSSRLVDHAIFVASIAAFAFVLPSMARADAPSEDAIRKYGETRPRAPDGWVRFDWPQKRKILFEHYGPSQREKEFIAEAVPAEAIVTPKATRKLLVFYQCQYPHTSIATANVAYQKLADATGAFSVTLSDDPADISPDVLSEFDALLLNNTTDFDKTVGEKGQQAILSFVRGGKGLIGIHAAADSCKAWPEGARMINGVFQCHPWKPQGTWAFKLTSPDHPINQAIGGKGFWFRDEIYAYRPGTHDETQSRELVSLDLAKPENHNAPELHQEQLHMTNAIALRPVAWIHRFGDGRVFYSNLGHNNTTYWSPLALQHYLAGIQYALGDLDADDTATSQLDIVDTAPAPAQPAE